MNSFLKIMILNKMKNLTPEEIIHYGKEYGFTIEKNEAKQMAEYLRTHKVDPFKKSDRKKLLSELAAITDEQTAQKANRLFKQMIKTYGLESLME